MDTLIKEREVAVPLPIQLYFGAAPIDADADIIEVFMPQPRWDAPDMDESLDARIASL